MFVAQDYAATTMEQIAAQAGVAVQTVYYGFGTKGRLLCEVVEVTAAGEDAPAPVAQRPWATNSARALASRRRRVSRARAARPGGGDLTAGTTPIIVASVLTSENTSMRGGRRRWRSSATPQ